MAKDTFYFSHDYNSRTDRKIKKLLVEHGMAGYGVYWSIVEDLYNNANALPMDYKSIAFDLRVKEDLVKSVINDFGFFVFDSDVFGSTSIERRLDERNSKSVKARQSANKRWGKSEGNANALQSESEPNAIKDSIVKNKKGKENSLLSRKKAFGLTLEPFVEKYGRPMVNEFYKYWTEPNKSGSKFKQEMQKTWDTERRLETWASNDKSFNQGKAPAGQNQTVYSGTFFKTPKS